MAAEFGKRLGLPLKPTAVVFCFVNEEWFALLRSVHSVIDGSPPELLKEIILVDDGSDAEWLQKPLEDYIRDHLPPFVKARKPSPSNTTHLAKPYLCSRSLLENILIV